MDGKRVGGLKACLGQALCQCKSWLALEPARGTTAARQLENLFLTSCTPDCIRDTLPIIPFTFRKERMERFADFLLTEFGDEFFELALNLDGDWCPKQLPADTCLFSTRTL